MPANYQRFYNDTPDYSYRYDYDDGYIYRVSSRDSLIESAIPLFGGGFAVGQPMPLGYQAYNVPWQYRDAYYDTSDAMYRYGDGAIYRVNPSSNVVESVVSLLSGDVGIGRPLPMGYDAYNVPLGYRDQWYDTNDAMYRYADGNIYRVDPTTMIVQAIVQSLV